MADDYVNLYELLGIATGSAAGDNQAAADLLNRYQFQPAAIETGNSTVLAQYFKNVLRFSKIRSGTANGKVGIRAEMEVDNTGFQPMGFSLLPLATIHFTLRNHKTQVYVTSGELGSELVFDVLKLDIQIPSSLLQPYLDKLAREEKKLKPSLKLEVNYGEVGKTDLAVVLRDYGFSTISVDVKVRVTEEKEVIFEPLVPISIGACRLFGLPCLAVHDIGLLFNPKLRGERGDERALEWTRHDLDLWGSGINRGGLITIRTLDLDSEADPLKSLAEQLNGDRPPGERTRFVLEDLALPLTITQSIPLPAHGTFGIRRNIQYIQSAERSFSFDEAPISVRLPGTRLIIEQLLLRTVGDITRDSPLLIDLKFLLGSDSETTLAAAIKADDGSLTVVNAEGFPDLEETKKPFVATLYGKPDAMPDSRTGKERIRVHEIVGKTFGKLDRGVLRSKAHDFDKGSRLTLSTNALGIEISDEWTVALSYSNAYGLTIARVFNVDIKLWGAKLGASLARIFSKDKSYSVFECMLILFDLSILLEKKKKKPEPEPKPGEKKKAIKLQIRSAGEGPAEISIHNIGFRLGSFNIEKFSAPEGLEVVIYEVVKLRVDELNWITENNGAQYISMTCGISFFANSGSAKKTNSESQSKTTDADKKQSADKGHGGGLTLIRARSKTSGSESAPAFLLDGIALELYLGVVELLGFGYTGEFELDSHRYEEFGFEIKLKVDTKAVKFETQLTILYGKVSGPKDNFKYWLAGFLVDSIPCGPVALHNLQALVASNLTPDIKEDPDSDAGNMKLFNWYKSNRKTVISLPRDGRKIPAWKRMDNSLSVGAGAGVAFPGGNSIAIDLFVFYARNPADEAFFILIELFLFGGKDPAAFGAMEYNLRSGAWGVLLGVELDILRLLSNNRSQNVKLEDRKDKGNTQSAMTLKLTGTIYFGNPPKTFMIGKLADQDSWLTLKIEFSYPIIEFLLLLALGVEYRDTPKGPKAGGFVFKFKAGGIFPVGSWSAYLSLGLIIGIWRNESNNFSVHFFIEGGFRFKVFFIFTLGVVALLDVDYIDPDYTKLLITIRFELPWFLPSFQFSWEKVWKKIELEKFEAISAPLLQAAALQASTRQTWNLALSLPDPNRDSKTVFNLEQLRALAPVKELPVAAELVPVDATITVDFKCSVNDRLAPGENTPTRIDIKQGPDPVQLPDKDAGTQKVNDVSVTYTLVGMSIQRRPRFSPESAWTDLLLEEETRIRDLEDAESGNVKFEQKRNISLFWDRDIRRDGALDPRRLLVNADLPYSFATAHPQGDEERVRGSATWPCCASLDVRSREEAMLHRLDFRSAPSGRRLDSFQRFSDSGSTLNWVKRPLPLVVESPIGRAARVPFRMSHQIVAWLTFDQPILYCLFRAIYQNPTPGLPATLYFDLFQGDRLVHICEIPNLTGTIQLFELIRIPSRVAYGRARIRLVSQGLSGGASIFDPKERLEILEFAYLSYEDSVSLEIRRKKCASDHERVLEGSGKFAWLPNHVYRIRFTTEIRLAHEESHPQAHETAQLVQFSTKGLPGLNAVERVGDEIEPYVEGFYPKGGPEFLYRREPTAIVFNERFNILSPLFRHRGFWNEHAQKLEWSLAVDSLVESELRHLSQTSKDWLSENFGRFATTGPKPPGLGEGQVLSEGKVRLDERLALSLDVLRKRFENDQSQPGSSCPTTGPQPKSSQVLRHDPVGEVADDVPLWKGLQRLRVNLRLRHAPFIERRSFFDGDFSAFESMAETLDAPAIWNSTGGSMRIGAALADKPSDGIRRYAVFGEREWDHIQLAAVLDPQGGEAGIAFAVRVSRPIEGNIPPNVEQAILILTDGKRIRVVETRIEGSAGDRKRVERQLGESLALPDGIQAPFRLDLIAYDDFWRVSTADLRLDVPRNDLREGQLALVNHNGGSFSSLSVAGLDAYRLEFFTSRYQDFSEQIADFKGRFVSIPYVHSGGSADLAAQIAAKRTTDFNEWRRVMADIHEREPRQRLFSSWLQLLGLPLQSESERLALSGSVKDGRLYALLLESPEPIPFSRDVTAYLYRIEWSRPDVILEDAPPQGRFAESATLIEGYFESTALDSMPAGPFWLASAHLIETGELEYRLFRPIEVTREGTTLRFRGQLNGIVPPVAARPPELKAFGVELDNLGFSAQQFAFVNDRGHLLFDTRFVNQDRNEISLGGEILSDGEERAALIFPQKGGGPGAVEAGFYRLRLDMVRHRYRTSTPDPMQSYLESAQLTFIFNPPLTEI